MDKNICPKCGGKLLIEAVGNYGLVYRMKRDGGMYKKPIRRLTYECSGLFMIYCEDCKNTYDASDYGYGEVAY